MKIFSEVERNLQTQFQLQKEKSGKIQKMMIENHNKRILN